MILRNPALWRDSFFTTALCFLAVVFPFAPKSHAQGISGHVVEIFSRQNISNATVGMYQHDSLLIQTKTDSSGFYSIQTNHAGRVSIHITHPDYTDYIESDLVLDGYSTTRLEYLLTLKSFDLPGITVLANQKRNTDFVRTIKPEDMVLVAGNFEDPVRIAHSQPGIVLLNDQANHLSARGQSPIYNNFYLEGLEIVNPNHTSNAGTLSDLPTQYGGGINMFSAQILGSTDIYLGLGPLSIDDVSGAAINMHIHESAKPEWRAKAGLIGLELGAGSKLGRNSILDFNLRYSFTGLLTNMGVDFGGEKIGFYDGVVSYVQEAGRHKLKAFAWAGRSTNVFDHVEPVEEAETFKDFFDIDYGNDILGAGGKYDLQIGGKTHLFSGIAYSFNHSTYTKHGNFENASFSEFHDGKIHLFTSFLELHSTLSDRLQTILGIRYTDRTSEFLVALFPEEPIGRIYLQSNWKLSPDFGLEIGGEVLRAFVQSGNPYGDIVGGYRVILSKSMGSHSVLFGGIRQSASEPQPIISGSAENPYSISRNIEIGWTYTEGNHHLALNAYWQHMAKLFVAISDSANYFLTDYPFLRSNRLITDYRDDGEANQYGVEATYKFVSLKNWHLEFNQSVYKSNRGLVGQELPGGRYDGRYATHIAVSHELFRDRKNKNRIWGFSMRGILNGGLRETGIDTVASKEEWTTIALYPSNYDQHLPAFKRIDFSITRTISTSNIRWRYSLDIQNLFSFTNIAYHYYDNYLQKIVAQEHLGIIPVLSVQASW
jgi:outer membrane receptor protein involved in Fe transport